MVPPGMGLRVASPGHLLDMARPGHGDSRVMEQEIRFCELDGRRIAYATVGDGPTLLFGGRWVTHLEEEWDDPHARSFFEELARTHRVVRYDRLGAGLSDRDAPSAPDVESETRVSSPRCSTRAARAGDRCSPARAPAWRPPGSRALAPERVEQARLLRGLRRAGRHPGGDARARWSTSSRSNWPLAAQMLAGLLVPHGERRRDRGAEPLPAALGRRPRSRRRSSSST